MSKRNLKTALLKSRWMKNTLEKCCEDSKVINEFLELTEREHDSLERRIADLEAENRSLKERLVERSEVDGILESTLPPHVFKDIGKDVNLDELPLSHILPTVMEFHNRKIGKSVTRLRHALNYYGTVGEFVKEVGNFESLLFLPNLGRDSLIILIASMNHHRIKFERNK